MKYPNELYRNGREELDKSNILDTHYLYARHKPGVDWNESQGLPDFTKIKIDPDKSDKNQSFNWDKLSEPHWVRFNPAKEYLQHYAVVGFLTETIRNIDKYSTDCEKNLIDVEHKPVDINYSHCQLLCTGKFKMITANRKK